MKPITKKIIILSVASVALYFLYKKYKTLTPTNDTAGTGAGTGTGAGAGTGTGTGTGTGAGAGAGTGAGTVIPPTPTPANKSYYGYTYGPAMSGCTIYWENKDGSKGSAFVDRGSNYTVPCMLEGSGSGCGQWTKGSICN